jgi:hypothetical protein
VAAVQGLAVAGGITAAAAMVTPARLREAYGVEAVVGAPATPQGQRLGCAPLVSR